MEKIYSLLREMHYDAKCELEFSTPYELLVAVILSAQCTDKRVNVATAKLFKVYNTPAVVANLTVDELKPYIYSCGFYNNKGKNIIAMSKSLMENHGGEVPCDFDALVELCGVGRKTASVVMAVAFNVPAVPVDTHVFRVSHRLGISSGSTPDKVEQDIKAAFLPELWNTLHHYMIFHGRYICHSRNPECNLCLLQNDCVYAKENSKNK